MNEIDKVIETLKKMQEVSQREVYKYMIDDLEKANSLYSLRVLELESQLAEKDKAIERVKNQKLNLLNDMRKVCYGIGINSPVRLRIQKMLDDFKDDEEFLFNHNIQKYREVEQAKALLDEAVEVIEFYGKEDNWEKVETSHYELVSYLYEGDNGKKSQRIYKQY